MQFNNIITVSILLESHDQVRIYINFGLFILLVVYVFEIR